MAVVGGVGCSCGNKLEGLVDSAQNIASIAAKKTTRGPAWAMSLVLPYSYTEELVTLVYSTVP